MTPNAVATPHHLSAEAGRKVLLEGGNAVDAAIAAVAAQGVVAPETCGLGGDLFAIVHVPGWERPRALNASGRSGSGASAGALRDQGADRIPGDHPAAVTVPGCVDGMAALAAELGRLDLAASLAPAIDLARGGFEVSTEQASAFARQAEVYRDNPAVADFYPNRSPVVEGDHVTRPDLGRTLESVATGGREAFYQGTAGDDISDAVGGLITGEDLAATQAEWIEPIKADVAGYSVWTIPPNSQGYLGPATLAVFEMLSPPQDADDPLWWHLMIEAYRCLAWERDDLVSEPGSAALPADLLLDHERLERAAATVEPDQTGSWPQPAGAPHSTAYLATADADGMAVSIIQSNYRGTGSPFGAARSGFLLQDRGMGFTLTPGHPNELSPGKRPLHTLSPTLWTQADLPQWVLGTRGGAVQPQLIAQMAARAIIGDADLESAQDAPRWTTSEFGPGSTSSVTFEPGVPESIVTGLATRGHQISTLDARQPGWGPVSLIELDGPTRRTAPDPRVDTTAALTF